MNVEKPTKKLFSLLKEPIDSTVIVTKLSSEFLETLTILEGCSNFKEIGKCNFNFLDRSANEVEDLLMKLKKEKRRKEAIINRLGSKLTKMDIKLNGKILCKSCRVKKIEKLTDKCGGNEGLAKFIYGCKQDTKDNNYIKWIPFNDFKNIEHLAKGGFGEVHKAIWIDNYNLVVDVVLKRLYNSNDKILDILNEVKV